MKKSIFTILGTFMLLLFVSTTFAQVPQGFNYQAVARNATGDLLQNQTVGVKISIHQGSSSGTVVYSERHVPTTNNFGLFTVTAGQGTVLSGTFSTIDWSTGSYWLQVELDASGGTTYTNMGTSQLLSVPYAMYAANAGTSGPIGPTGPTGPTGAAGTNGTNGVTGPTGAANISGTTNYLVKFTGATTGGNSVVYEGTGTYLDNIGIGTTFPNSKLHINAASGTDAFRVQVAGNTKMFLGSNGGTTLGVYSTGAPANGLYVNGQTLIGVSSGTAGSLYQIGAKLQVQTTTKYAGYFSTDSLYYGSYALYAKHTATGSYDTRAVKGEANASDGYGYGGDFLGGYKGVYAFGDGGAYASSVMGVQGYATGTAGTRYGIFGSASGGATNYGVYCSGNGAYTGTWTLVSDKKFKKDVVTVSSALDNILKLRPVSYNLKTEEFPSMNFPTGKQYGFIAQEMEEIFPTLVEKGAAPGVNKDDADIDYKGVNYIGLIPILVKALQEQQEEINALKLEIKELKK